MRAAAEAAGGWRQVARSMHDPNSIIDARSASPTTSDFVAAISDEGLQKKVSLKECFSYERASGQSIWVGGRCLVYSPFENT